MALKVKYDKILGILREQEEGSSAPGDNTGVLPYETKELLDADTTQELNAVALVYNDQESANGFYRYNGTLWVKVDYGEAIIGSSREVFQLMSPVNGIFNIDYDTAPYAELSLSSDDFLYTINIVNIEDGESGKILIKQPGYKQVELGTGLKGGINLPLSAGVVILVNYKRTGQDVYAWSTVLVGDGSDIVPQRIIDFVYTYFDATLCSLQWTAPYANNVYTPATMYDIRYSNTLIDADDLAVWNSLKKLTNLPVPGTPGTVQTFTMVNLAPGTEYYVYIKSFKVNNGIRFTSLASNFVYFKTHYAESVVEGVPYRVEIKKEQLFPSLNDVVKTEAGILCTVDRAVDELQRLTFDPATGYVDTTNKGFQTYWLQYAYGRNTMDYKLVIDLFQGHKLDKLFIYCSTKIDFSVLVCKDLGSEWVKVGEGSPTEWNHWHEIAIDNEEYNRFVIIRFGDTVDIGENSTSPTMTAGSEAFPEPIYNYNISNIDNIVLYATPQDEAAGGIHNPIRSAVTKRTMDQFFCTNGHFYQQGRIHSMLSGKLVRLFGAIGHLSAWSSNNVLQQYTRLADMRFRLSHIPWVMSNNGTGKKLQQNLESTYKPYGLKPFICSSGLEDHCMYNATYKNNRPVDDYWYPGRWKPLPKRGVGGLDDYYAVTKDPLHYGTYAKLCYAIAAKYGGIEVLDLPIYQDPAWDEPDTTDTGLDLMSGLEPHNEPDAHWDNFVGFTGPEELAALLSACYDGNSNQIIDEDSGKNSYGMAKTGDPAFLKVMPGLAGFKSGYVLLMLMAWRRKRTDNIIPVDCFNFHMYCSTIGADQGSSNDLVQKAITVEESISSTFRHSLLEAVKLRNLYAPGKEVWCTEFGYGESGGRETQSKYQCYSQPGRVVGNWTIPDRHRSEVKGAWIIRGAIQMLKTGVDLMHYYSTECEANYFGAGLWDQGAGFEMWEWRNLTDNTPGAKYAAIEQYETPYDRGGFATTGIFGNILTNGAYPVTNAYWWIATFRSRVKGYIFTGMKYLADPKIVIACFKKLEEDKGAYVVYYNDSVNTGVENVSIPVPEPATSVTRVDVYLPRIPDPRNVPATLGTDELRTGIPTTRKEKYTGGQWVIQNIKPDGVNYESYAAGDARYPDTPQEGDEVHVLPSVGENPYFPVAGPVAAKLNRAGVLAASQHELSHEEEGVIIWEAFNNAALAWRQVDAVCDYIQYHPEGIRGAHGDETVIEVANNTIIQNVSEFPVFYLFDAAPKPDFVSEITDLKAKTVNHSTIELYWNNTNPEDTGYEIFSSELPESGYSLLTTIIAGDQNKATVSGLIQNTTTYFKVRPIKGDQVGTLSTYVAGHTASYVNAVTNLAAGNINTKSIGLSWAWTEGETPDFYAFYIYRATSENNYALVGQIKNKQVRSYVDTNLTSNTYYYYKIRVICLNGKSEYSDVLQVKTLSLEEAPPLLVSVSTNKLGTYLALTFSVSISPVSPDQKSLFSLTENGNARLIESISNDLTNPEKIYLGVPEGTLGNYSDLLPLKLSYVKPGTGGVTSIFDQELQSFTDITVINNVGNFLNLYATYKLNFIQADAENVNPSDATWNNLKWLVADQPIQTSGNLIDTYQRTSGITLSSVTSTTGVPLQKWGENYRVGKCLIEGIPGEVYLYGWGIVGFYLEGTVSRLILNGLNQNRRYTIKAYASSFEIFKVKMKANGFYSNETSNSNESSNTDLLLLEDLVPVNGQLSIDFLKDLDPEDPDKWWWHEMLQFMIIEEYLESSEEDNTVHVNSFVANEDTDQDGNISTEGRNLTFNVNYIGAPTHYMLSENSDFSGASWIGITDTNILQALPFTVSSGYGSKTVYLKLKNAELESNIKSYTFNLVDPYVPLALNAVYINENAEKTDSLTNTVMFSFNGTPTHYRIAEGPDMSGVEWIAWTGNNVQYTFQSSAQGVKYVYAQLKDAVSESSVIVDSIDYGFPPEVLTYAVNGGVLETSNTSIPVVTTFSGNITGYAIGMTTEELAVWTNSTAGSPLELSLNFNDKPSGNYNIMLKLRNTYGESSLHQVTLVFTAPALALSSVSVNDGAATTGTRAVTVDLVYSGYATHYMLSENSDFSGASWVGITAGTTNLAFTLSESAGSKTVYAKLKNSLEESSAGNDAITYEEYQETIVLSARNDNDNDIIYDTDSGVTINRVSFGTNDYSGYTPKLLKNTLGQDTACYLETNNTYYPVTSETGVTGTYATNRTDFYPTLSGNTGPYPDFYLAYPKCLYGSGEGNANKGRFVLTIPAGTYKVRIIMSVSGNGKLNNDQRLGSFYRVDVNGVAGTPVVAGPSGFTGENNTQFNAEIEFTVGSLVQGNVSIMFYNTISTYFRPSVNLFEITKLS